MYVGLADGSVLPDVGMGQVPSPCDVCGHHKHPEWCTGLLNENSLLKEQLAELKRQNEALRKQLQNQVQVSEYCLGLVLHMICLLADETALEGRMGGCCVVDGCRLPICVSTYIPCLVLNIPFLVLNIESLIEP